METDQQYAIACAPQQSSRVCGVLLQPFCLGHLLVLQGVCSPFVAGSFTTAAPMDLVFAIWTCSRPASQSMRDLGRPFGWRWRWLLWRIKLCQWKQRMRYITRLALFQEYVNSHFIKVETWLEPGKTSRSGLPLVALYKRCLMSYFGYTEAEALNLPLPKVIWEYTAWLEAQGALQLVSEEEREIFEELKTMGKDAADNGQQTTGGCNERF